MSHIFTYGSLMFEPIWNVVVDGVYENSAATIFGYCRRAVIAEDYPALIRQTGSAAADGILYFNVTEADISRLDEFEGSYYTRIEEQVLVKNGSSLPAEVYIFKNRYRHLVSESEWDPAHFEKIGMRRFIEDYAGFRRSM